MNERSWGSWAFLRRGRAFGVLLATVSAACGSSSAPRSSDAGPDATTEPDSATAADATIDAGLAFVEWDASVPEADDSAVRRLRVMVTDDDGYGAAGIDALVEALWARPELDVSVVAPAVNESGTGGQTTPGVITATDVHTGAGRAAKAVAGFPADCLTWAVDQHGLAERPDLVISGINLGENVGPSVEISGTVGAARAAGARGIPALAASQVLNGASTDFAAGAALVLRWVDAHRAEILSGSASASGLMENLNIPSCTDGTIRGVVRATIAAVNDGILVDCTSTLEGPADDVAAINAGFAVLSTLPPAAAADAGASDD